MYNYTLQATHHAKFDFDPTIWVVWATSQFATVLVYFFFVSFFCFLRLAYKSHRQMNRHHSMLSRPVLRQGCAFWGVRIFNFHIFGYFSLKIVKIKPEIHNFKPKC